MINTVKENLSGQGTVYPSSSRFRLTITYCEKPIIKSMMEEIPVRQRPRILTNRLTRLISRASTGCRKVQVEAALNGSQNFERDKQVVVPSNASRPPNSPVPGRASVGEQVYSWQSSGHINTPSPDTQSRAPASDTALPSYLRPLDEIGAYPGGGPSRPVRQAKSKKDSYRSINIMIYRSIRVR